MGGGDRAARPVDDFTTRLAADADSFIGVLAGAIPLRQFMSPRTMVRGDMSGFARLTLSQARPRRTGWIRGLRRAAANCPVSGERLSALPKQ